MYENDYIGPALTRSDISKKKVAWWILVSKGPTRSGMLENARP
jgi:hypothetical protein